MKRWAFIVLIVLVLAAMVAVVGLIKLILARFKSPALSKPFWQLEQNIF